MKNEEYAALRVPFFSKAVLSFLLPLLASLSILGFFSINSITQHVRKTAEETQSAVLGQAGERIEYIFDEINALAINYSVNQRVQYSLKKILQNENFSMENWNELSIILNMLSVSHSVKPYIHSIYVYFENSRRNFITSELVMTRLESYHDTSWYEAVESMPPEVIDWIDVREAPNSVTPSEPIQLITVYKRIYSYNTKAYAGVVVFNIKREYLSRVLQESALQDSQILLATGRDGELLASNFEADPGLVEGFLTWMDSAEYRPNEFAFGKEAYSVRTHGSRTGLKFYSLVPNRELYTLSNYFLRMNFIYIGIALVMGIALIAYLTNRSNRQIQDVVSIIKSAKSGRLVDRPLDAKASGDSYQSILYNILSSFLEKDYLKVQLSEKLYRERLDELMALQAQINPHFLFNTLQTVNMRAIRMGGLDNEVSVMIESLSHVLRYSMENPGAKVTLGEEVAYAKSYLSIQEIRYKDKLVVSWECDPRALGAAVPKLFLQPLLENSIHHGLAGTVAKIRILVRVERLEGQVRIIVQDDGAGMEDARLKEMLGKLAASEGSFDHIGLLNTNRRLRLMFGDAYSLVVESVPGKGATVEILIPA
jgi:two-component system sensor histidine kinase YesM